MKKIFIFIIFSQGIVMAQINFHELENNIKNRLDSAKGTYALAFRNLQTGETIFYNEREEFHAASTMKTPVMLEVFKQAAEGKFLLDDSILVKNEIKSIVDSSFYQMDISDDGGENLYKFIGSKKTIRQLVYDMITVSSNLATNILIDLIGADNVMMTMHDIGANVIKVLRGVEDIKAYDRGLNNTTDAYDLMLIFEKIANGDVVSSEACKAMVNILLDQKFNSRIPSLLPKEVKVAHKTGSITGVEHDSGIIILPDGRKYVLVILSKNLDESKNNSAVQAELSRMIYDYVIEK
ncbi:MAG: class A beta-lactamase-related serine hydrolase [Ignavibacteriaceae bacterium]|nr:class A beta-lactamase-related serine hydrolase [Ignavibacteriaceae bacterium]